MRRRRCLQASSRTSPPPWHAFIKGVVYADTEVPWGNDPAYGMLQAFPGLRETVNGRMAAAITQTLGLVQALTQVNDEIPMSAATFQGARREIVRVLAPGGFVVSRGSSGLPEAHLAPYGHMLLKTPQVAVFQRDRGVRRP
jgi:hypothetical protein